MSDEDTDRFRAAIATRLGLQFDGARLEVLAELLRRRAQVNQLPITSYSPWLATQAPAEELMALAEELTVGETYFFRNFEQFEALARVVVPARVREPRAGRTLQVLSAGCASGEEAYSLAIIIREALPDPTWDVSVCAIDINPAALQRAARGRFTPWSLRETPAELQRRWFRQDGRDAILDPSVASAVRFEQRNLSEPDPTFWIAGQYDVVFCRNVLMYFTPEAARAVVARLEHVLSPGGYLFLGHAETLRGLSTRFHLCHTHGTFYYQLRDRLASCTSPTTDPAELPPAGTLTSVIDHSTSWIDAIQHASDRIRALSETSASIVAAPRGDLGRARDLFHQERFVDALASLPVGADRDPDALLLRALVLTHSGDLAEAERTCQQLVTLDELSAGAHYVMALCRESAGDARAAAEHDQIAVYLDPTFAMPRLHLGLLARRAGDRAAARREMGQALLLLQREDTSRLLLFGGGFHRDALVALCKAELETVSGT